MEDKTTTNTLHSPSQDSETIVSVLARHLDERPNHQLFHWVDKTGKVTDSLSYKELWDKARAVAQLLEAKEVQHGDRVMIAYPFGLEFLAGLVGCMMAGVIGCSVYPPNPKQLDTDLPPFNLKVNDAGAKYALTTTAFRRFMSLNNFIGNTSDVTWLATDHLRTSSSDWSPRVSVANVSPNDVAFIQYTSGSTGFPKGVMISQRSLVYNARLCAETCSASHISHPTERSQFTSVSWMPQYHDMGLIGFFFMTIFTGTVGVACSPLDFILNPILWHDLVIKFKAQTTMGPNFSFGLLVKRLQGRKRPFEKWTFVNRVVCAAEPVDPEVMGQVVNVLGVNPSSLYVGYGLAEVGLAVCFSPYSVRNGLVACGDLNSRSAKLCIVDEVNQKVEDGIVAEVFVQSPSQVALGYWGNPEATSSTFLRQILNMEGDWLATGDLGKVIDNKVYITGRMKEIIILNGRNFFPVDIERVVEKTYPLVVRPGCVVAYQHSNEGVGLVADLRKGVKAEDGPKAFEISNLIAKECQVPTEYVCLLKTHSIPKTTSGKIMRVAVKDTSIAGTWSKKMIELEWRKPQKTGGAPPFGKRRASALERRFSHLGVDSSSEFVTAEMFAKVSRRSLTIRNESVQRFASLPEEGEASNEDNLILQGGEGASSDSKPAKAGGIGVYGNQGMSAFYAKHGTCPYKHGNVVENATIDYATVVSELRTMEARLDSGEIKRDYDAAEYMFADSRFWRAVPGVPPKQFALAQDAAVHKDYVPWLNGLFAGVPRLASLRVDIKEYIAEKGGLMNAEFLKEWVFTTMFHYLASKRLSPAELSDFKRMHSRVIDLVQRQTKLLTDEELLSQKTSHLQDLMERLNLDDNKASALLDILIFAAENLAVTLNICTAVMFAPNEHFDLKSHQIGEANIMSFVWECIRMFPTQAAVAWREQGGGRHASVIGMAGRDPSLWGEDVDSFRLDRCSADEFSEKSCFFAEQAGNYACRGKAFVLEATSAFLLELIASGPWICSNDVSQYPVMPFFDKVEMRRVPKVVVVGAGAAGLICALRLSQRGIKVTLIEKNDVLGGHARHAEVFGGHMRNPAFGAFVASIYPNLMGLIDALGLQKVVVCSTGDFRQNIAFDGHQIPGPDPKEVARFLAQMHSTHRNRNFRNSQTIGDFLEENGYDYDFICRFIVGKLVHYFAGLTIQQYLEIPLELFAWFVVADSDMGQLDNVFRLRNKEYTEAFASSLAMHGVEIVTGVTPELLSRSDAGVSVDVGDRVVSADKMVLAMPPNAAAAFLGEHLIPSEAVLCEFDCQLETVVLHQDPKWSTKDGQQGIFGIFPNAGKPLPSRGDTIPMTTALVSDMDVKTPIFSTHAYANYSNLHIEGAKECIPFTHVRITCETAKLRTTLLSSQGKSSTYFAGGWLRGFMLHEDALVTGTEVANDILKGCGLASHTILRRKVELHSISKKIEARSESSSGNPISNKYQSVIQLIELELGRDVHASDSLQDLGLSSLTISALHVSLQERFELTDNDLPVSVFFEGEMLVGDLVARVISSTQSMQLPSDKTGFAAVSVKGRENALNIADEICALTSDEVGSPVGPGSRLEELGLTSLIISSLHAALQEKYDLSDEDLPVSILLEGTTTIKDVIQRVQSRHGDGNNGEKITNTLSIHASITKEKPRRPHEQPLFDSYVASALQLVAIVFQAIFLGCTLFIPVLCSLRMVETIGSWRVLFLSPLIVHVHAATSALLLIIVKWTLVGRQKEGHTTLWSSRFAAWWIVRQCSRLVWTYTLWGLCGEMEILNILHRLLGCSIGEGVSIEPGCVSDYDLVKIGNGTSIAEQTTIITSTVSLGVQSLNPVEIGADCTIKLGCLIDRGAIVGDGVVMENQTLVTPFSKLEDQTAWHGKPAERSEVLHDIESGSSDGMEPALSSLVVASPRSSLTYFDVTRVLTVFVLTPFFWVIEFGIVVLSGSAIYGQLGYLGLGGLIWVPPTVVCILLFVIAITMKKLLLGKVQPGVWPRGGSFHARKYFVDHLIKEHAVRWKIFSTNTGSFLAGSVVVERQLLRWLGVKVGTSTALFAECWTKYDLLSVGSRVVVGGYASFHPWKTTDDSFIAELISISDDCFIGANAAVMNGVEVSKGSAVASYSLATRNVEVGRTVIGTREYQTTIDETDGLEKSVAVPEVGKLIGLCGVWIGIFIFVWLCFLVAEGTNATTMNGASVSENAIIISCISGGVFLLVLPCYFIVMMWLGKAIILGRIKPISFPSGNKKLIPRFAYGPAFLEQFLPYAMQAFGGTFVETCLWAALGANIGNKVYLDGIVMYEPDLVTIGDWSSVTQATLTSHHLGRRTNTYSPLTIGNRCTISNRCNLQLASLDDDTDLIGLSMPLTSSKLKSGTWVGYPAKRIGDAACQPPRPRRSAWITLLFSPYSTFLGCIWLLTLPLQTCMSFLRNKMHVEEESDVESASSPSIPDIFKGAFLSDDESLKLKFDKAEWMAEIRILQIPAGSCMASAEGTDDGDTSNWWWRMANYEFDLSNDREYVGRVSLGWWNIPLSIATAKIRVVDGKDLSWSHSWFTGDPKDEMLFRKSSDSKTIIGGRIKQF